MSDISINIDRAERWKEEVDELVARIDKTMKRIHEVVENCAKKMPENDVLKGLYSKMANAILNAFTKLVDVFNAILKAIGEAIQSILDVAKRTGEMIEEGIRRIRNSSGGGRHG